MSWVQRLSETYDACFGCEQFAQNPLTPIDHVEQQAHIEITLDEEGNLLRASLLQKETTLIPATEKSAGRTSGAIAHPLCDKVRYVAPDYSSPFGDSPVHHLYLRQLRAWVQDSTHPRLGPILRYVERGKVISDLLERQILSAGTDGRLETHWAGAPPPIAKLLTPDPKSKQRDQGDALIRWRVELPGELETAVWKDTALLQDWARFNAKLPADQGLCMCTGQQAPLASSHPKRLRHGGDGAKLISSNDNDGFTFRGRFTNAGEAYGLSSAETQKAHNALRWLIARQGTRNGEQVIVSWAAAGQPAPQLAVDSSRLFLDSEEDLQLDPDPPPTPSYAGDAGQSFALRLGLAIRGYQQRLGSRTDITVMALDSATPGRMAILYYRELKGSEFLQRIERWHSSLAWHQNFGKERQFLGAPAPRDIAEVAYGSRVEGKSGAKLLAATVERLLPCIVDGRPLPRDLMQSTVQRATNRASFKKAWDWERVLGIACSLVRGSHPKEYETMGLDEKRFTRDYLYGRLLAIADNLEGMALWAAGEKRDTNAVRLMQRFADHPYSTWRNLELQLRPYIARLRSSRPAALSVRLRLLDEVIDSFPEVLGESSFTDNRTLSGEFLLGFHSQRAALRPRQESNATSHQLAPDQPVIDQPEGENQ